MTRGSLYTSASSRAQPLHIGAALKSSRTSLSPADATAPSKSVFHWISFPMTGIIAPPMPRRGDAIVEFYSGGRDSAGRTLDEILAWDDDRLEAIHDYIQWLFPTRQPSGVNPFAPLVTDATVRAFA